MGAREKTDWAEQETKPQEAQVKPQPALSLKGGAQGEYLGVKVKKTSKKRQPPMVDGPCSCSCAEHTILVQVSLRRAVFLSGIHSTGSDLGSSHSFPLPTKLILTHNPRKEWL